MIRDITLGQYYPTDSVLHRLDPRVKLCGTLIYIISLFLFQSFTGYIVATVFLVSMIVLSHVPVSFMIKGLKAVFILLIFTAVLNCFLTPGRELVSFWKFTITKEGLRLAAFMVLRIVYLIIGSSIMTLTTTPSNLTDGLEKGLGWMKILKVPVHEIAMMMSIALTFIPVLLEETDKIIKAQQARGADFESGNLIRRVRALVPILVPLFVSAFRRANDLAIAMEARCYRGGEGRTKLHPLKYASRDVIAYIVLLLYLAAIAVVGFVL
ncbi:MAG: energy-coupling factor transporter transmembrane protein EcfT [Lachnospiraceae bacterium]|jgi:energy-coupling factor transport system permease protein|nr:energy-coupling factor transporter transmembrane protein EcfT [Lachnospiraceae bacterium]